MALLNRNGEVLDRSTVTNGATDAGGVSLTPLDQWRPETGEGLLLDVADEPEQRHTAAPLIAIDFPAFTDGRGLSLAVLLRTRYQFTGELRAVGEVHPDVMHYMKRCGFDTFQISDRMSVGRSMPVAGKETGDTLAPYSDYYQASVLEPDPAYRRIRRGA